MSDSMRPRPGDDKIDLYDHDWWGFWRALDCILTRLPRGASEARRDLCVAAQEWDHMIALAALVRMIAPLAEDPSITERLP